MPIENFYEGRGNSYGLSWQPRGRKSCTSVVSTWGYVKTYYGVCKIESKKLLPDEHFILDVDYRLYNFRNSFTSFASAVFIVCNVSFTVCLIVYVYCCVLCLSVVPLPRGKTMFAVQLNNNNNNLHYAPTTLEVQSEISHVAISEPKKKVKYHWSERSKARTVFVSSNTAIVGSNPT
jgi:hypothetical protein